MGSLLLRNTPTGVGKTFLRIHHPLRQPKHPHGCGEDGGGLRAGGPGTETPPRVWGRRRQATMTPLAIRNTPTGVGKTVRADGTRTDNRKHPHGCGEDTRLIPETVSKLETPPRVWGRRQFIVIVVSQARNTPTGVGKTRGAGMAGRPHKKHPHGCGEDSVGRTEKHNAQETPPRVWGRLSNAGIKLTENRNTPTGVGKTYPATVPLSHR